MPAYRLYHLDGTGRFHGTEVLEASSDEEAIELSAHMLAGSSGELWLAARMVCRFPDLRATDLGAAATTS